jgi:hypothetical protein
MARAGRASADPWPPSILGDSEALPRLQAHPYLEPRDTLA